MKTQATTNENINRLIEFRQAVYAHVFQARRDALFETLDALLSGGTFASFAYLSQSTRFRRKWPSLYAGVEDGEIDGEQLRALLVKQLPQEGICYFPLDGSSWPRPRSRVLEDLQYVYQASSDVDGGNITVGYPYSLLEWCAEPHSSWSLPLDVRRVPSQETAQEVGAAQVQALAQARQGCQALDIVAADGKYGNAAFLRQVHGLNVGIVTRLHCNRVLYRPPQPSQEKKRGRPRKHGVRFDFKDKTTWREADEVLEFSDEHYGQVRLERWKGLHERRAAEVVYDVIRAQVHLEKDKPPEAVWFAWLPPVPLPTHVTITARLIWEAYVNRWPIEPGTRFRKETLGLTLPRFQSAETGDTWALLVALAHWMLFLARPLVTDSPLPWQKTQSRLTPQRVWQSFWTIFVQIGTPACPPKPRGKSPGWPKGKARAPKKRYSVVKKGASDAKTA